MVLGMRHGSSAKFQVRFITPINVQKLNIAINRLLKQLHFEKCHKKHFYTLMRSFLFRCGNTESNYKNSNNIFCFITSSAKMKEAT